MFITMGCFYIVGNFFFVEIVRLIFIDCNFKKKVLLGFYFDLFKFVCCLIFFVYLKVDLFI